MLCGRLDAGQSKKLKAAAVALYTQGPTAAEAATYGLTLQEAQGEGVEIWPDNVHTVNVFIGMWTQWRIGVNGATGLDYTALPFVLRVNGVKSCDRAEVFDGLQTMEAAALNTIHAKK